MEPQLLSRSFIVRVALAEDSEITGTIERVSTGERYPFRGVDSVAALIAWLAKGEHDQNHDSAGKIGGQ